MKAYIRLQESNVTREFVEIEDSEGNSIDIVKDCIADGRDTLLEIEVQENER